MKKLFLFVFCLSSSFIFSQFKIDGKISNFSNENFIVKIFTGSDSKVINKIKTDDSGKFSVFIPENYSGIISFENNKSGAVFEVLSDNEEVVFDAEFSNNVFKNINFKKGESAKGYDQFKIYENYSNLKNQVFQQIKTYYNKDDDFYKAIEKEENRINTLKPDNNSPLIKYYAQVSDLATAQVESQTVAEIHMNKILNRLVNDNEYLEGSGLMPQLVMNYLRYSLFGKNSPDDVNATLEKEIDKLLDETDIETSRGQNVLTSVFLVLPKAQFGKVLEKYYDKASKLTCEITDDLKASLFAHSNTQEGTVIPNIVFAESVKGFKSLYEVKADKKIVVFWASWCPACRQEMAYLEAYYENFKNEGGEIVGISLDVDEDEFNEATKNYGWVNYTELSKWDTQGVKEFGVGSTPTFFLVDKDNKLIKKTNHLSELVD